MVRDFLIILEVILLFIFMPFILHWSITTIFLIDSKFDIWNWLACLFMFWFVRGPRPDKKG